MTENETKRIVPMHVLYDMFKGKDSLNGADKVRFRDVTGPVYENFNEIRFSLRAVNYRFPEAMSLIVSIPAELLGLTEEETSDPVCCEDFVLRSIHPNLSQFAESLKNANKDSRSRGELRLAGFDNRILKRSCIHYADGFFHLNLFC
ncbi:MAG: hypothetical protein J6S78_09340, partial [Lachnospiraceae bacterium]|nr:hypothetical protein [Lachnospiraceae bacterium]